MSATPRRAPSARAGCRARRPTSDRCRRRPTRDQRPPRPRAEVAERECNALPASDATRQRRPTVGRRCPHNAIRAPDVRYRGKRFRCVEARGRDIDLGRAIRMGVREWGAARRAKRAGHLRARSEPRRRAAHERHVVPREGHPRDDGSASRPPAAAAMAHGRGGRGPEGDIANRATETPAFDCVSAHGRLRPGNPARSGSRDRLA